MTKSKLSVQEEIAPNLIPMVDIMFLLLLFFMLSADMGQRQLEDVKLPGAKSVKIDDEVNDRLTINVFHAQGLVCPTYSGKKVCREDRHWRTHVAGNEFRDNAALTGYLKTHAPREKGDTKISERKVMIRVDSGAPYGLAQRAMNACAESGLYKIEVGAALPPKVKKT
jgi:biopolymer transport protein ExbD